MRIALISLFLIAMLGCTTKTETVVVTEYKDRLVMPTFSYITECRRPFNTRPKTYGESVERDQVWLCAFERCALKIMGVRDELGLENQQELLCIDETEQKKVLEDE